MKRSSFYFAAVLVSVGAAAACSAASQDPSHTEALSQEERAAGVAFAAPSEANTDGGTETTDGEYDLQYLGLGRPQDGGDYACNTPMPIKVVPPVGFEMSGKKYPLFLYFTGTSFNGVVSGYNDPTVMTVLNAMAQHSFYAASVQYFNTWESLQPSFIVRNLNCIYGKANKGILNLPQNRENVLEQLCSLDWVDCSKIAVWGYSQGAVMAIWAGDYEDQNSQFGGKTKPFGVGAAWLTGYSDIAPECTPNACDRTSQCKSEGSCLYWPKLPTNRLRVVNGADDGDNKDIVTMKLLTGQWARDPCKGTGTSDHFCFDPVDGSGWYLVSAPELVDGRAAGHCWFDRYKDCNGEWSPARTWVRPALGFSIEATASWLEQRAAD